jgi:surface polysaccharide O-acyltransferase-like enzyme
VEWYLRPTPNHAGFTLFPWAGFLFAGAIVGELIHAARTEAAEWRLQAGLAVAAVAGVVLAYLASLLPSIYAVSTFWNSSPTFFFIRLGIVTALVPLSRIAPRAPALETLGRSSLFVYWIHVEMVYGLMATPIKRSLPLGGALVATLLLSVLLYGLVLLKDRVMARASRSRLARGSRLRRSRA